MWYLEKKFEKIYTYYYLLIQRFYKMFLLEYKILYFNDKWSRNVGFVFLIWPYPFTNSMIHKKQSKHGRANIDHINIGLFTAVLKIVVKVKATLRLLFV
ncbi:MAG: hypothetical protein H6Q69_2185 [Firmicutes bacterium]|nr:hypothetical protein [Bacillota bacterium]